MGFGNSYVVEQQTSESIPTGTPELDSRRLGSNPAVGCSEIVERASICLGTYSIISGIYGASRYQRIVRVLDINAVVVRRVEVSVDGSILNRSVLTPDDMQATIASERNVDEIELKTVDRKSSFISTSRFAATALLRSGSRGSEFIHSSLSLSTINRNEKNSTLTSMFFFTDLIQLFYEALN